MTIVDINAKLKASNASSVRGAGMGRKNWGLSEHRWCPMMMYLQQVRFVDGGYDLGGAYWGGGGDPLFCAWAEDDEARVFVRAKDRGAAKLEVKRYFPNAKFFR